MLYPDFEELALIGRKMASVRMERKTPAYAGSATVGQHVSPFHGQGLEFREFRHYTPGDDVRNIDWRVTARTGVPHLRTFAREQDRTVFMCVDMNLSMLFGTRCTFKSVQAARVAAALFWCAYRYHDRVGGCVYGAVSGGLRVFPPMRTRQSVWQMLGALCHDIDPHRNSTHSRLTEALKRVSRMVPTGGHVFIISDFLNQDEKLYNILQGMRKKCGITFVIISDIADRELPAVGRITTVGSNGSSLHIDTGNSIGGRKYTQSWNRAMDDLHVLARNLRSDTLFLSTQDDVCKLLANHFSLSAA
jgi:uncharacterized protein (DUF58 family)